MSDKTSSSVYGFGFGFLSQALAFVLLCLLIGPCALVVETGDGDVRVEFVRTDAGTDK